MRAKLFTRLHGLDGGNETEKLRLLAVNGNAATRLGIARQENLDQRTLEVLARRGPSEVRRLVARHPRLTAETASIIMRHLDGALKKFLTERFECSQALPSLVVNPESSAVPAEEPKRTTPDHSALDTEKDHNSSREIVQRTSYELFSVSASESLPEANIRSVHSEATLPTSEPELLWHGIHPPDAPSFATPPFTETTTDSEFESDFTLVIDELEAGLELLSSSGNFPLHDSLAGFDAKSSSDEAAEVRFLNIFQKLPTGEPGKELLRRIGAKAGAPKFHKLKELYDSGLDVDSLAIAWTVRERWNEERSFGRWNSPLTYEAIGNLVQSFPNVPDVEEVLGLLRLIEDEWRMKGHARSRDLTAYITDLVLNYAATARDGDYVPFEFVLETGLAL